MYIGSAAMTIPMIQRARENQNGLMGSCAIGAGTMISIGIGKMASNILNKAIDKTVDFWDDVKPVKPAKNDGVEDEEKEAD